MLKRHAGVVAAGVFAVDLLLTVAAFLGAYAVFRIVTLPGFIGDLYDLYYYLWLLLFVVPAWAVLLQASGSYRSHRTESNGRELKQVLKSVLFGGIGLFAMMALLKSTQISRPFITTFIVLNAILLVAHRVALRLAARWARARGHNTRSVLIVGTGEGARALARRIAGTPHWGFRVAGFVSESGSWTGPASPVLGTIDDMPRLLRENVIDEVFIAIPLEQFRDAERVFLYCEETGVNTRMSMDLFPHRIARPVLDELDGHSMLTFTTTPRNAWALAAKRTIDLVGSGLFLAAFSWLYLIIAVLVKATSRGPVFYRQVRVGINGRRFTFFKFRSMIQDAEKRLATLSEKNEMDGPVFKIKRDPRITRVGRFLRKFSLDELPQMWNVFRGDMSLVGPRPPVPAEVDQYEAWARRRLSVRPGLTCLWQVGGRNEIGFQKWMEMDLEYIDNWSLGLDFKILVKTVPAVLAGKGAS